MQNKLFLLSGLCLSTIFFSQSAIAYIESDKKQHLAVSYGVGLVSTYYFDDPLYGFSSCFAVGLAKEIYDEIDYEGFDGKDLAYDALGCALGTLTIEGLQFAFTEDSASISYNYRF